MEITALTEGDMQAVKVECFGMNTLPTPMKHVPVLALLLSLGAAASHAQPSTPTERDLHSVACVAALDVNTEQLAVDVKGGRDELRPMLRSRLESGAAFIGAAYLQGERDEARSKALLDAAREAQKTMPDADLAKRQAMCAEEGSRMLAETNFFGRAVVSRLAERRMKKLLGE